MSIRHPARGTGDPKEMAMRLKQRITLQEPNETDDGGGGTVRGWSDVATLWAEVLPVGGARSERLFAAQLEATVTHRVIIRYRTGVTAAMRISYAGRYFNIRSVVNVAEAGVMLEILAEEGAAV